MPCIKRLGLYSYLEMLQLLIQRGFKKKDTGKGLEMLFPEHYMTRSQDFPEWMHDAGQFYWGRVQSWLEESMNFDENSFAYKPLTSTRIQ